MRALPQSLRMGIFIVLDSKPLPEKGFRFFIAGRELVSHPLGHRSSSVFLRKEKQSD